MRCVPEAIFWEFRGEMVKVVWNRDVGVKCSQMDHTKPKRYLRDMDGSGIRKVNKNEGKMIEKCNSENL